MRHGIVITLAISGLKNRIHRCGDKVNEEMFPQGRFTELVQSGAIQFYEHDAVEAKQVPADDVDLIIKEVDETPQGIKEAEARGAQEKKPEKTETEIKADQEQAAKDDTTRTEIMVELDKLGVKYNKDLSKNELYELWRSNKK